jgi:predicted nucleic-acid-binding protein
VNSFDTNIVARWLIRDDEKQARQVDELLKSTRTARVSDVVFFELEHLARSYYMMDRELVAEHIQAMIDSTYFTFDKPLWSEAVKLYVRYQGLSMADCYLALTSAEKPNEKLITFDKALAKKLPKFVELV